MDGLRAPTLAELLALRARYAGDPDGLAYHLRSNYPEYWRRLLAGDLRDVPGARELALDLAAA